MPSAVEDNFHDGRDSIFRVLALPHLLTALPRFRPCWLTAPALTSLNCHRCPQPFGVAPAPAHPVRDTAYLLLLIALYASSKLRTQPRSMLLASQAAVSMMGFEIVPHVPDILLPTDYPTSAASAQQSSRARLVSLSNNDVGL
jgi:hypothetical protein